MRKLILLILVSLPVITSGSAFSSQKPPPKFSSVYTDLSKQCKAAFKESEIGEGQDMPQHCKGYGGYRISIGYSAMYAHLNAETLDGKYSMPLTMAQINYDMEKGRKIEWRLANGKPFAVIFRVEDKLFVKGLRGYEKIDYDIDVKTTTNPNQTARDMADKAYLQ